MMACLVDRDSWGREIGDDGLGKEEEGEKEIGSWNKGLGIERKNEGWIYDMMKSWGKEVNYEFLRELLETAPLPGLRDLQQDFTIKLSEKQIARRVWTMKENEILTRVLEQVTGWLNKVSSDGDGGDRNSWRVREAIKYGQKDGKTMEQLIEELVKSCDKPNDVKKVHMEGMGEKYMKYFESLVWDYPLPGIQLNYEALLDIKCMGMDLTAFYDLVNSCKFIENSILNQKYLMTELLKRLKYFVNSLYRQFESVPIQVIYRCCDRMKNMLANLKLMRINMEMLNDHLRYMTQSLVTLELRELAGGMSVESLINFNQKCRNREKLRDAMLGELKSQWMMGMGGVIKSFISMPQVIVWPVSLEVYVKSMLQSREFQGKGQVMEAKRVPTTSTNKRKSVDVTAGQIISQGSCRSNKVRRTAGKPPPPPPNCLQLNQFTADSVPLSNRYRENNSHPDVDLCFKFPAPGFPRSLHRPLIPSPPLRDSLAIQSTSPSTPLNHHFNALSSSRVSPSFKAGHQRFASGFSSTSSLQFSLADFSMDSSSTPINCDSSFISNQDPFTASSSESSSTIPTTNEPKNPLSTSSDSLSYDASFSSNSLLGQQFFNCFGTPPQLPPGDSVTSFPLSDINQEYLSVMTEQYLHDNPILSSTPTSNLHLQLDDLTTPCPVDTIPSLSTLDNTSSELSFPQTTTTSDPSRFPLDVYAHLTFPVKLQIGQSNPPVTSLPESSQSLLRPSTSPSSSQPVHDTFTPVSTSLAIPDFPLDNSSVTLTSPSSASASASFYLRPPSRACNNNLECSSPYISHQSSDPDYSVPML